MSHSWPWGSQAMEDSISQQFYVRVTVHRVTVHRNKSICNKTN
jgi:hypothetical protein